jgi:peptide/nickel transport system permease protein
MKSKFRFVTRIDPITGLGFSVVTLLLILGLSAPLFIPYDIYALDPESSLQPPSAKHLFGTGIYGEDIFSRVLYGARYDLPIAFGAVAISLLIGITVGAISGYLGGPVDEVAMRLMDVVRGFPSFILAMALAAALGPELKNVILAVSVSNIPNYARIVRAKVLSLREWPFAQAAVAVGNPWWRVLAVHLLPNTMGPILVQATTQCGWAILTVASLSFIGLGLSIPQPEWGVMVSMGLQRITTGDWWISFFPGLAIMIAVMGFNLAGDGLQDLLDPRRR